MPCSCPIRKHLLGYQRQTPHVSTEHAFLSHVQGATPSIEPKPLGRQLEKFPPTAAQGQCFDLLIKLTVAKVR